MSQAEVEIADISWGRIEIRHGDRLRAFRDCKLWPTGAKDWDWRLTGTHHQPGIQPADIAELLEHQLEIIILSRGMHLVLQTCPETLRELDAAGIEARVEETRAGAALFNELARAGRRVAGLFHSTC